jgi:hypothetical protein
MPIVAASMTIGKWTKRNVVTTGEIAANICLETPGVDTLDILVLWKGFPTYASTQTIFAILRAKWYYLEQNKYVEWAQDTHFDVNVPGQHGHALVTPWTGTSHPVWFKDDPRVANCKALLSSKAHIGRRLWNVGYRNEKCGVGGARLGPGAGPLPPGERGAWRL